MIPAIVRPLPTPAPSPNYFRENVFRASYTYNLCVNLTNLDFKRKSVIQCSYYCIWLVLTNEKPCSLSIGQKLIMFLTCVCYGLQLQCWQLSVVNNALWYWCSVPDIWWFDTWQWTCLNHRIGMTVSNFYYKVVTLKVTFKKSYTELK